MSTEIPETTAAEQPAAPPEVRERHAALSQEIEDHRVRYYLSTSTISDADFDALMHELQGIEEQYTELRTPDSPTQKVGIPISTDRKSTRQNSSHPQQSRMPSSA